MLQNEATGRFASQEKKVPAATTRAWKKDMGAKGLTIAEISRLTTIGYSTIQRLVNRRSGTQRTIDAVVSCIYGKEKSAAA